MTGEASGVSLPDVSKVQVGVAALIAALLLGIVGVVFLVSFSWPSRDVGGGWLEVGHVIDYEVGMPVTFPEREFYLVKQKDGSFRALYWASPHLGCKIDWRRDFEWPSPWNGEIVSGWFYEVCGGSLFDVSGKRVYGPAPHSMDRLPLKVEGGRVYVFTHPSRLIRGDRP
jgi:nitrite reductase/ring-hydroxylating ferredoxin subunit